MKKISKLMSAVSAAVLIFVLAVFSVSASDIGIMPCSDYTTINSSICQISGASSVKYGCQLQGTSSVGEIKYTCQLQIKNGAWTDVKGESFSGTRTRYVNATKTVSATIGEEYRCKTSVKIYSTSGALLESYTRYSAGITR